MSNQQYLETAQAAVKKAEQGLLGASIILGLVFSIFLWTLLAGGFSGSNSDRNSGSVPGSAASN